MQRGALLAFLWNLYTEICDSQTQKQALLAAESKTAAVLATEAAEAVKTDDGMEELRETNRVLLEKLEHAERRALMLEVSFEHTSCIFFRL